MTSVRKLAVLVLAVLSLTGLAACGGGQSVSDASFVTDCKKEFDKNARTKAYSADICKCVQQKLEDQGLEDEDPSAEEAEAAGREAGAACVKEVVLGT